MSASAFGTVISFGPGSEREVHHHFWHAFTATNAERIPCLTGRLQADDGAVVYLNGVEIFRRNLPPGQVNFTTLAASAVEGVANAE